MTVNNPGNPEIHISEEKLQKFGLVLLGIAVLFTIIGAIVSPLDDQGKPVLFYRKSRRWRITGVLRKRGFLS